MTDEQLIEACRQMQRPAQRILYERMAPKLYHTCKRYLRHQPDIEDVLAESCYQILTKIDQLKNVQALDGWARRIAVHLCLLQLKKQTSFSIHLDETLAESHADASLPMPMDADDLMRMMFELPDGCRTVFNLFAIEGYSHREIAGLLGISEGTSKSQLNFARKKLQEGVLKFYDQSIKRHEQA